jgi:two-component system response regulator FlrC
MRVETIKTRVLLAEEDIVQRLLIREYLEMEGRYEISETDGVHPLLDLCKSGLFRDALLLLDMQWSKADGVDVILEIRKRNPGITILGMLDHRSRGPGNAHLNKLRFGLLYKPFSPLYLHRNMNAILKARVREGNRKRPFS